MKLASINTYVLTLGSVMMPSGKLPRHIHAGVIHTLEGYWAQRTILEQQQREDSEDANVVGQGQVLGCDLKLIVLAAGCGSKQYLQLSGTFGSLAVLGNRPEHSDFLTLHRFINIEWVPSASNGELAVKLSVGKFSSKSKGTRSGARR